MRITRTNGNGGIVDRGIGRKGPPLELILIVCEGSKTEPNYFKGFRVSFARVIIEGAARVTVSLVEHAMKLRRAADPPFEQVWCVFDKDDCDDFDQAVQYANDNDIHVAYSNQAFELWYVLHFDYLQSSLHRNDYENILSQRLNRPYRKNSRDMYEVLMDKQSVAIRNAERLNKLHVDTARPSDANPSTTVHELVVKLNSLNH